MLPRPSACLLLGKARWRINATCSIFSLFSCSSCLGKETEAKWTQSGPVSQCGSFSDDEFAYWLQSHEGKQESKRVMSELLIDGTLEDLGNFKGSFLGGILNTDCVFV